MDFFPEPGEASIATVVEGHADPELRTNIQIYRNTWWPVGEDQATNG
jgi:hypothetical protein